MYTPLSMIRTSKSRYNSHCLCFLAVSDIVLFCAALQNTSLILFRIAIITVSGAGFFATGLLLANHSCEPAAPFVLHL